MVAGDKVPMPTLPEEGNVFVCADERFPDKVWETTTVRKKMFFIELIFGEKNPKGNHGRKP